jgi:hypothetical protein
MHRVWLLDIDYLRLLGWHATGLSRHVLRLLLINDLLGLARDHLLGGLLLRHNVRLLRRHLRVLCRYILHLLKWHLLRLSLVCCLMVGLRFHSFSC